jgi:CelD/BcsL family acetyltransferase involved in cellulose biosynthesis
MMSAGPQIALLGHPESFSLTQFYFCNWNGEHPLSREQRLNRGTPEIVLFRFHIATTKQEVELLRKPWEWLEGVCGGTIFQTFLWNLLAVGAFAQREAPAVVYAESDAGMAIIPAAVSVATGAIVLLGETLFDYRTVLAAGDRTVLHRAWRELSRFRKPVSSLALREENDPLWEGFSILPFVNAPFVSRAEMSSEAFEAKHTRSARAFRRLRRAGMEVKRHSGTDSELVRMIYERKSHQPHATLFTDPQRRDFMVAIAAAEPSCEIFTLQKENEIVAAVVALREESVRRTYTVYFDTRWAKDSPGHALVYEVTRISLAEGLDCDFMTGEYPYKNRLATGMLPLYRAEATAEELAIVGAGTARPIAA